MKRSQQGVALISMLLILGLALLLIGGLLHGHRLLIQSTAQQIQQVQMRQWALSAEALARQLLRREQAQAWSAVHHGQAWARGDLQLPVDGGEVHVRIEDLGGRFNLAALLGASAVEPSLLRRWRQLSAGNQLPFIDPGMLAGAQVFDLSQLRHLPGLDAEALQRLTPLVALLPRNALLNINTAPAPVLASLGIPLAVARRLVAQRPADGYPSVQAFLAEPLLSQLDIDRHGLGLTSDWFRVRVRVTSGEAELWLVSDLAVDADRRHLRVLQRRLLTPIDQEASL